MKFFEGSLISGVLSFRENPNDPLEFAQNVFSRCAVDIVRFPDSTHRRAEFYPTPATYKKGISLEVAGYKEVRVLFTPEGNYV